MEARKEGRRNDDKKRIDQGQENKLFLRCENTREFALI